MNNYHYIVAGLPVLDRDYKFTAESPETILEEIKAQCSEQDVSLIDFLLSGYEAGNLDCGFYRRALTHPKRFIREWFRFDLNMRNAKVRYLNAQIGRPLGKDVLYINADEDLPAIEVGEFEEEARADAILAGDDLLGRERGLDDLCWEKLDEMTCFDWFDIEAILGFICKLQICARWFRLDEQSGREMFRRLVDEIRGTFKGVNYQG